MSHICTNLAEHNYEHVCSAQVSSAYFIYIFNETITSFNQTDLML